MYLFQPADRGFSVGEPVPGSRHDARAFHESGLADQLEGMVKCGDKGYQGHVEFSPNKRRSKTGRLHPDIARNNAIRNSMRAAVERAIAHLKG
ncbi:transposase family protein [Streptosporangium sp. NPDC006007]|uniref:transposase family protein n=1 Tax=Streptosporangium sp. NPDC006007 TaxID=3154575 RepID=UPI0033B13F26